jgi:phosphatidylglycerophosphatase A
VALTALGVWAADIVEAASGHDDDQRIVIDEIVGQLWLLLPLLMWMPGRGLGDDLVFSLLLVTAFVLFRVLDIVKPGPVGWAERRFEGGLGVMADDLVAGGIGAVMLALLLQLLMALGVVTQAMPGPQRWWWGWAA